MFALLLRLIQHFGFRHGSWWVAANICAKSVAAFISPSYGRRSASARPMDVYGIIFTLVFSAYARRHGMEPLTALSFLASFFLYAIVEKPIRRLSHLLM